MTTARAVTAFVAMLTIAVIAIVVSLAIGADRLWSLIGGMAVSGAILIVAGWMVARNIVVPLLDAKSKRDEMRYDLLKSMVQHGALPNDGSFIPMSIAALPAPAAPPQAEIDPRHDLLVNLCLLTIKSAAYGPTSKRLMSADDAQADRSGIFAAHGTWEQASKYGQSIRLLYTQNGGKPEEQGLKVRGNATVADLLVSLHSRNLILDAAINALPVTQR